MFAAVLPKSSRVLIRWPANKSSHVPRGPRPISIRLEHSHEWRARKRRDFGRTRYFPAGRQIRTSAVDISCKSPKSSPEGLAKKGLLLEDLWVGCVLSQSSIPPQSDTWQVWEFIPTMRFCIWSWVWSFVADFLSSTHSLQHRLHLSTSSCSTLSYKGALTFPTTKNFDQIWWLWAVEAPGCK